MTMHSRRRRTLVIAHVCAALVLIAVGCTGSDEPEPAQEDPITVTTKMATEEGAPATIDERLFVKFASATADQAARVNVSIEDDTRTVVASDTLAVSTGDVVDFEGWAIHFERVGESTVRFWAIDPDGVQFGGEPRD